MLDNKKADQELMLLEDSTLPTSQWVSNPYISAATSDNTRKAYRADIAHYEMWGGRLPANPELITHYLQAFAETLNPRTLARRLTALKNWHAYQGFPDPTAHPVVQKTLAGILRTHGKPKDKAWPLLPEDLFKMAKIMQAEESLAAFRDNALLQLGFFGAFRRSELVKIYCEHISKEEHGWEILIPNSKTDQTHTGQFCAIPYGNAELCPIRAVSDWLTKAGIAKGPLFRRISTSHTIDDEALTPLSVNHILKKRAFQAGLPFAEKLSSHSLRRGLATSASRIGAPIAAIMRQGRWKQVNTVMEYIEATERFTDNAASRILSEVNLKRTSKQK